MASIVVLFQKQENARSIRNLLIQNGLDVMAVCTGGSQAIQRMEEIEQGLIVCGSKFPDMMYQELRDYLPDGVRMLLLASQIMIDQCNDSRISCLAMPVKSHDFIEMARQILDDISIEKKMLRSRPKQRTREEVELLEEVKEILITNNRISEKEAHSYIQKRSMNSGIGLIEMARLIKESFVSNELE